MSKAHLETLKQELTKGQAQLFDIREESEWDEGHLPSAVFVPLSGIRENKIPANLDTSKKTYIHCRSGNRVKTGGPLLQEMGFKNLVILYEGYEELKQEGVN